MRKKSFGKRSRLDQRKCQSLLLAKLALVSPVAAPVDQHEETVDEELEFESWKLRELKRIQRDRERQELFNTTMKDSEEEEDKAEAERAENEGMKTEGSAALIADITSGLSVPDNENEKDSSAENKSSMGFGQRYFHRGAFFSDEQANDPVFQRDFHVATGDDKFIDKSSLPSIMQVKNFGRRGQTKYTHLAQEDTSKLRNPELPRKEDERVGRGFKSVGLSSR